MKVTRILGTSILLLGVATAAFAQAPGALRLNWNDCDPLVPNRGFTGPATYFLVLSVSGASLQNNGHRSTVTIGNGIPNAWHFEAGGCQTGQLAINHGTFNKACPAFQGGNPLGLNQYSVAGDNSKAVLDVANTYDTFAPVAGTRYSLYRAQFNHAFSAVGPGDPSQVCDFADKPLCFVLTSSEILRTDGSSGTFSPGDQTHVTWEDPNNSTGCPGATPAEESSTWGRVKGLYR